MKNLKYLGVAMALGLGLSLFPGHTLAATPTLSLSSTNNGDVKISVHGDSNSTVRLYYFRSNSSSASSAGNIGTTNSSGNLSLTVDQDEYDIPSGNDTYVVVNGQQSSYEEWPSGDDNDGDITFSKNNVNLDRGDDTTVTISGGSGSYYIFSNSNSNLVDADISGRRLELSATNSNSKGTSNILVCSNNNNRSCGTLRVTVNGSGNNDSVSFSQDNLNLSVGQSVSVNVYGPGSYRISRNTNSNVASADLNDDNLNIYANSQGSTSITVCSSRNSNDDCDTLRVNVNNNGYIDPGIYIPPTVYPQNPGYYPTGFGNPSAGVFLTQVPSTGISINLKMFLFFIGLFMWSAFISYIVLAHKRYSEYYLEE